MDMPLSKEEISKRKHEYYLKNKKRINKRHQEYYERNKEKWKIYQKEWMEKNREDRNKYMRIYYQKNKERIIKHQRGYKRNLVKKCGGRCENPECSTPNGYNRSLSALEFHHVNPEDKEKSFSHRMTKKQAKKLYKLWKESKVKLLCSNCHHELHEKYP